MGAPHTEAAPVLQRKLGENGLAALQELLETHWRERAHELEDAAWQRVERRLDRIEAAIERLTDAQARTEARVDGLEAAMQRLAEAQARTEERLDRLEAAVQRLAQAQARTEKRVDRLEDAVQRLAEAQARTEAAVQKLSEGMDALRQEVGALSENVGFGLEGIARTVLPGYLERHLDIHVLGPLGEELQPRLIGPEGREEEFDLYGIGVRDGEQTTIVGEVRSRIYSDDVRRFLQRIATVRSDLPEDTLPVLFGYNVHPAAREEADRHDLLLVAAYQR